MTVPPQALPVAYPVTQPARVNRRGLILGLVLVLAVLAFVLCVSGALGSSRGRWEYKVVSVSPERDLFGSKGDVTPSLDRFGEDGWELVSIRRVDASWEAVFKRRR